MCSKLWIFSAYISIHNKHMTLRACKWVFSDSVFVEHRYPEFDQGPAKAEE